MSRNGLGSKERDEVEAGAFLTSALVPEELPGLTNKAMVPDLTT